MTVVSGLSYAISVSRTRKRGDANSSGNVTCGLILEISTSAGGIANASLASSVGLTVTSVSVIGRGEALGRGAPIVRSSLESTIEFTNVSAWVAKGLAVGIGNGGRSRGTTIEVGSTNGRGGERSSTVLARTVCHAVSTSAANAVGVKSTVSANTGIASRLVLLGTTIVGHAVIVGRAGSARSSNHAILSSVAISVVSTRGRIFAYSSSGVTNSVGTNIEASTVSVHCTSATVAVSETVRSSSTSTVSGGEGSSAANG